MSRIKKGKVINLERLKIACELLYIGEHEDYGTIETLPMALMLAGVNSNEFKRAYQFYLNYVIDRGAKK